MLKFEKHDEFYRIVESILSFRDTKRMTVDYSLDLERKRVNAEPWRKTTDSDKKWFRDHYANKQWLNVKQEPVEYKEETMTGDEQHIIEVRKHNGYIISDEDENPLDPEQEVLKRLQYPYLFAWPSFTLKELCDYMNCKDAYQLAACMDEIGVSFRMKR